MQNPKKLSWWSKGVTFLIWLLLGCSLAYWWLMAQGRGSVTPLAPTNARPPVTPAVDQVRWALAGGAAVSSAASASSGLAADAVTDARFQLVGLVAQGQGGGAALLAVDGQVAKPYRVGALVLEPYYLAKVLAHSVVLRTKADGTANLEIKLASASSKGPAMPGLPAAFVPPAAMPATAMMAPAPSFKSETGVSGEEEAQAPAVQRPVIGQALGSMAGNKGPDGNAKGVLAEMFKSSGGITPPLPATSAGR